MDISSSFNVAKTSCVNTPHSSVFYHFEENSYQIFVLFDAGSDMYNIHVSFRIRAEII